MPPDRPAPRAFYLAIARLAVWASPFLRGQGRGGEPDLARQEKPAAIGAIRSRIMASLPPCSFADADRGRVITET